MVALTSLLIPILLSAVAVFMASSIMHMVLKYHNNDFVALPNEEAMRSALQSVPPGDYALPWAGSIDAMKDPVFKQKMEQGPIAFMTVLPSGHNFMGTSLALWFVYCAVVSLFAGYIASRALGPGAEYIDVFRFVGTTAFVGYSLALWQNSIWYKRKVSTNIKTTIDGLVYALITAGMFGWLWPS